VEKIEQTYGSPRWSGELFDCSLPVTLDTYSNCSYGCVYCFSQYQRGIGNKKDDYFSKKVRCINVESVKKIFSGENKKSQFYKYVKDKRPIQYGGLSDQFDEFERKYGKTYELLKFLREINYPICFSTKATWFLDDPKYVELFKGADNWNIKFSIITLDENDAKKIEVGVPSPRKRLEAMKKYNKLSKGGTTLRLRPFLIGVSDKTYLDLIKEAHEAGASAVTTEFFCLELRSLNIAKKNYKTISDVVGFDIVDFYRKFSSSCGYLRLNRKIKKPFIEKMKNLCDKLKMRFYVSDADFKEVSNNCCCCALNKDWNYSRGNFSAALQIAKKCAFVRWSDIEKDMYFYDFDSVKATGCNVLRSSSSATACRFRGLTFKDALHFYWNNVSSPRSPYKMFNKILMPSGYDEKGDIIYKFNDDVTFLEHSNQVMNENEKMKV
jgi:DNA repair photolyase